MRMKPKLAEIQDWVKTQVSPFRYRHIQGVARIAESLAVRHGLPRSKALLAAWLHDCAKEMPRPEMKAWLGKSGDPLDEIEKGMPGLWHPHVGAAIARGKWRITDPSILEAIRCHTLGKAGMGRLAQLLFVADFIEPGRQFEGVRAARRASKESLTQGVLAKASMTLGFLFEKNRLAHPRLLETWNYFTAVKNEKT